MRRGLHHLVDEGGVFVGGVDDVPGDAVVAPLGEGAAGFGVGFAAAFGAQRVEHLEHVVRELLDLPGGVFGGCGGEERVEDHGVGAVVGHEFAGLGLDDEVESAATDGGGEVPPGGAEDVEVGAGEVAGGEVLPDHPQGAAVSVEPADGAVPGHRRVGEFRGVDVALGLGTGEVSGSGGEEGHDVVVVGLLGEDPQGVEFRGGHLVVVAVDASEGGFGLPAGEGGAQCGGWIRRG